MNPYLFFLALAFTGVADSDSSACSVFRSDVLTSAASSASDFTFALGERFARFFGGEDFSSLTLVVESLASGVGIGPRPCGNSSRTFSFSSGVSARVRFREFLGVFTGSGSSSSASFLIFLEEGGFCPRVLPFGAGAGVIGGLDNCCGSLADAALARFLLCGAMLKGKCLFA